MQIDYGKVVQVLAEEVAFARNLKCKMEDPYGNEKEYTIKDISFHILRNSSVAYQFDNSFLEDVRHNYTTTLLIRIWIGNSNKLSVFDVSYDQVPLQPESLKIFIRRKLYYLSEDSVKDFFSRKNKDNKYARKSADPPEVYLEDIPPFNETVADNVLKRLENFSRELYLIKRVLRVMASVVKQQSINIVVDSEGRRIAEAKDKLGLSWDVGYLNSQLYELIIPSSFFFLNERDLVRQFGLIKKKVLGNVISYYRVGFIDTGLCPIMFDHVSTHTLFHEGLAGHLLSGDYIVNDESTYFKNHQNLDLTDLSEDYAILKKMTILVDPTRPNVFGGYKFDQEGVRAQKTVLCDRGVVKNYLLSRNSAARLKTMSNGHARAQTYFDLSYGVPEIVYPEPRISHLVINSHQGLTDAQLVKMAAKQAANGRRQFDYYLGVSANSGMVDLETGTFTMNVNHCVKVYFDGRRETIYGGTISGTPHDLLAGIKAVGQKNYYDVGHCGSASGWVPISSETPKMLAVANFVPSAKPKPRLNFSFKRDKYVPDSFLK